MRYDYMNESIVIVNMINIQTCIEYLLVHLSQTYYKPSREWQFCHLFYTLESKEEV